VLLLSELLEIQQRLHVHALQVAAAARLPPAKHATAAAPLPALPGQQVMLLLLPPACWPHLLLPRLLPHSQQHQTAPSHCHLLSWGA
jgi:hypothetical protein